ncbi:potassium-transporting ATPase subunit KdpC [Pseudoxanthomonas dokdonensis]|uniref:Potassium-transporting ATPase KdpC subunit n=1 Tax=Pseudoxanthomonas dokdonensis TaxID=344882 RepID=A0A0R0CPZ4_9GAMM|nr:potassium-transporting ATPase subunit KdpC [Pseudoxanthomonas dokdonensis]KRG71993.1 potassium-transporting ATPase subunit C [Pseudoxanthomonas dokdonensis]
MSVETSLANPAVTTARIDGGLLRASLGLALIGLLLFGLGYSLLAMGLGRLLFPHVADGSLIRQDGRVVGSALVAQPFAADRYFQPRPSAAAYDPMALSASNQARSNPALIERIEAARSAAAEREGIAADQVPGDLFTQSGSGIDPDITPAAARIQIARVAAARGLSREAVAALLERHIEPAQWGLFGAPRVNVLELNLALDALDRHAAAQ